MRSNALSRALSAARFARSSSTVSVPTSIHLLALPPASHPGFTLLRREAIAEHACVASLFRHDATDARLLSVACSPLTDREKVFGVALKTPPADSTGVAHVLEHSVLCGSARYRTKEPFVELLKSSLQTFLNAMTYPDRTVYPVASPNEADFRNLVRVYLDAVFHPNLERWTMLQEGWHYEVDEGAGASTGAGAGAGAGAGTGAGAGAAPRPRLSYKGVVFNEMKGVYSSADSIHGMACESALFNAPPLLALLGRRPARDPAPQPQAVRRVPPRALPPEQRALLVLRRRLREDAPRDGGRGARGLWQRAALGGGLNRAAAGERRRDAQGV